MGEGRTETLNAILSLRTVTKTRCDDHAPLARMAVSLDMNQLNAHSCSYRWPRADEVEK